MKKLKLPNGFGSISYYGEHRRKPYVCKKYIKGKQKPIGYFATYEDALAYLVAYNKNPSLFNPSEITFSEIFKLWSAEHFPKIAKSTSANYTAAYKHCELLYSKKFIILKISDLQAVIRAMSRAKIGYASQKKCRHTCATLLDNAGANDTAVKRILGHASQGVTKGTYTHKSLHELKKAIDLI